MGEKKRGGGGLLLLTDDTTFQPFICNNIFFPERNNDPMLESYLNCIC